MFYLDKKIIRLGIAVPASLTLNYNLRDKTVKAGLVARAAAIFRVDDIFIYLDKYGVESEGELLCTLLRYCETPQYLRKRMYKLSEFLKYAGILPPLKIPSHTVPTNIGEIKDGDFREGVVVKNNNKGSLIDIGLEKLYPISKKLRIGERVTVKVHKQGNSLNLSLASKNEINVYWGYTVHYNYETIIDCIRNSDFDLIIATSKHGNNIHEILEGLSNAISNINKMLILFGSPYEGLFEICRRFNSELSDIAHFIVNTIPSQGCETVRTEESIFSTLSILNLLLHMQTRKR